MYIQGYGLCIVFGILLALLLMFCDQKRRTDAGFKSMDEIYDLIVVAILTALVGGRLLYVLVHAEELSSWKDVFYLWDGGFSVLGSVFVALASGSYWLYKKKKPFLRSLDFITGYLPLVHSFGRIGCGIARCCGGVCFFFPLQIVVSFYYLAAFILLKAFQKRLKGGMVSALYLIILGGERIMFDFFRDDRGVIYEECFSLYQMIGLFFCLAGIFLFWHLYTQAGPRN